MGSPRPPHQLYFAVGLASLIHASEDDFKTQSNWLEQRFNLAIRGGIMRQPNGTPQTWHQKLQRHLGSNPGTVIFATLFFLVFAYVIWDLTSSLNANDLPISGTAINRLIALLGALVGWALGILFAPFSAAEKEQFQGIAKVISAFVAGYLLSKAEVFFQLTLFPKDGGIPLMNWLRLGIFAASMLLGALIVFIHRLYAFRE